MIKKYLILLFIMCSIVFTGCKSISPDKSYTATFSIEEIQETYDTYRYPNPIIFVICENKECVGITYDWFKRNSRIIMGWNGFNQDINIEKIENNDMYIEVDNLTKTDSQKPLDEIVSDGHNTHKNDITVYLNEEMYDLVMDFLCQSTKTVYKKGE